MDQFATRNLFGMQFYFDLLGALRHLVFLFAEAGAFFEAGIGPVTTSTPSQISSSGLPNGLFVA